MADDNKSVKGSGWVEFCGIIFLMAAAFNLIAGIGMLAKKDSFSETSLMYLNLTSFAVFFIIIAVVQLAAGAMVLRRQPGGKWLGVAIALLSACCWFFALDTKPGWALLAILLNVLVIHGLTAYPEAFYKGD